ncbi:MAG: hypothetical protein GXY25_05845, partial [Pirellulaceae bacterium]|nr:hypothetical protein [Pirellulaceae bacterium]
GGDLLIGGGDEAWEGPFGDSGGQVLLPAASPLLVANPLDGWSVVSNECNLRIVAVDGAATYDIALLGLLLG